MCRRSAARRWPLRRRRGAPTQPLQPELLPCEPGTCGAESLYGRCVLDRHPKITGHVSFMNVPGARPLVFTWGDDERSQP